MLNKPRLLTPGPTPLPESVRLALARDMIHHRKKDFEEIMFAVQKRLQQLFGTVSPVLPLACTGTGAMTAAVYSLFEPGERVLCIQGGKFGERWEDIAKSRGLKTTNLFLPWGTAATPEQIIDMLDVNPEIKGVLIQLSETSTGVLHPVKDIAAAMAGRDALLIVDGISAVGISPCPMDEWHIDCLLTGSQKGLLLPPGLALLALSERAWSRAESISPGCFYFNLPRERASVAKGQTNFTTPVNLIIGLKASLDILFANGLDEVYSKQWALTMLTRAGARAMGLGLLAADNFAWGLTAIRMPEGVDGKKVLNIARDEFGVTMAGAQDQLKGKIVRIGHMGWVDWGDCLAALYALDRAINIAGGYSSSRDYLETAMAAYKGALRAGAGNLPEDVFVRS